MRIGLVLHRSPAYSETFFEALLKAWLQLGLEVTLCVGWEEHLPTSGYLPALPTRPTSRKAWTYLWRTLLSGAWRKPAAKKLYRLERQHHATRIQALKRVFFNLHLIQAPFDHLHFGYLTTALEREFVGMALNIPATASIRGSDIGTYPLQHDDPFVRLWPQLSKVHVLSEDLLTLALQQGLPTTTRTQQITPVFWQPLPPPRVGRHLTEAPLRLVWVGRMVWKKAPQLMLNISQRLKEADVAFSLDMLGDGPLLTQVQDSILSMGLTEHVMAHGQISHRDILGRLNTYDLLIHTAWQEGFGNALLEAQAAGLWVIAAPAEGIRENIIPGTTGTLTQDWTEEAFIKAIIAYRDVSITQQNIHGQRSQERIRKDFSWDKHLQSWSEFFAL